MSRAFTNRFAAIREAYMQHYQKQPMHIACAPGRVNLIGEHTDYNNGWVLPLAIDRAVLIAARTRPDKMIRMIAVDRDMAESQFSLETAIDVVSDQQWSNYLRGVAALMRDRDINFPGLDILISGDIPIGAGLSSSAALLVAGALLFQSFSQSFNQTLLDKASIANLCQRAEHQYCGLQSGIMDQFVIALAQREHALLIDCDDLSYQHIPIPKGVSILVCNTMRARDLNGSEYNARRAECEEALKLINQFSQRNFGSLREVKMPDLVQVEVQLSPQLVKRTRHVIGENQRVLQAVTAARSNDLDALGALLNESHDSLRYLYEVSCPELDTMVDIAREQKGVIGARLTGAGFGGCTVNLVRDTQVETVINEIGSEYQKQTGIVPEIYKVQPVDGASIIIN